ncbi:endonuclease/exonuclease/phosphatase family protein [Planococcus koreensis]|uniref:endonuclease/exonuclease/phosphatase family protein n=1 Tax=Planococcus koreensis TaxID=112331 RepID=UPI0039FD9A81
MRIATFNVWNKEIMWTDRLKAICEEVKKVNADIIALQEVRTFSGEDGNINVAQYIANNTDYPLCIFKEYPDSPDEGLAFLSKIPIADIDAIWHTNTKESNYCAIRLVFNYDNFEYGITNVHLNWRTAEIREEQMHSVNTWIAENAKPFEILCGDFNDTPDSNIHNYLQENMWLDLAVLNEEKNGVKAQATLDHSNNSHLKNKTNLTIPLRYDWILLKKIESLNLPVINSVEVFGNMPVTKAHIFPSDHYGVVIDIT